VPGLLTGTFGSARLEIGNIIERRRERAPSEIVGQQR
jgi:hypothetical protein